MICFKMIVQKNSPTGSFPIIFSVLSVLLYCAGFLRVELVLNQHQERIIELQEVVEGLNTIVNDGNRNLFRNAIHGKFGSFGLPLFTVSIRMLRFSFSLASYIIMEASEDLTNSSVAL